MGSFTGGNHLIYVRVYVRVFENWDNRNNKNWIENSYSLWGSSSLWHPILWKGLKRKYFNFLLSSDSFVKRARVVWDQRRRIFPVPGILYKFVTNLTFNGADPCQELKGFARDSFREKHSYCEVSNYGYT